MQLCVRLITCFSQSPRFPKDACGQPGQSATRAQCGHPAQRAAKRRNHDRFVHCWASPKCPSGSKSIDLQLVSATADRKKACFESKLPSFRFRRSEMRLSEIIWLLLGRTLRADCSSFRRLPSGTRPSLKFAPMGLCPHGTLGTPAKAQPLQLIRFWLVWGWAPARTHHRLAERPPPHQPTPGFQGVDHSDAWYHSDGGANSQRRTTALGGSVALGLAPWWNLACLLVDDSEPVEALRDPHPSFASATRAAVRKAGAGAAV